MIFEIPALSSRHREVIERVDQLRQQLGYALRQHPKRWSGLLRRSTFARAIQASNSIEGYHVTLEDAVAAVIDEQPANEADEAWRAVRGYREAMSYILQLSDDPHFRHNVGTLRGLHYMMLEYDTTRNPGRWRPGAIFVRREPENEVVYEGPPADMVPALMDTLVESLNARSEDSVLVRAAMAHLNLVMIHPCSDGNGRLARALQTLVLAREGILDPNFCSIEEYLGRYTQEYYSVLAEVGQGSWQPANVAEPWIRFCLTAHYRQAETLLRRTNESARLWSELEAEVLKRKLHERMILALFDAATGFAVRNPHYRKAAEISEQLATNDLRTLTEQGLLVAKGERRGRSYLAGDWLRRVRSATRQPRVVTDPFTNTRHEFGIPPGEPPPRTGGA